MRGMKVFAGAAASALLIALMGPVPALADTIEAALVRAYQTNPQLNAQRAQVRITDENVPQALSGYRPKVAVTASAGLATAEDIEHLHKGYVGLLQLMERIPTHWAWAAEPPHVFRADE